MSFGMCACAGWHGCMCARVGIILAELSQMLADTPKQLPCRLVDVVRDRVHVCMYACVIGAAVGTILDELSCLRCTQLPCRLADKYSNKLEQILRSPC